MSSCILSLPIVNIKTLILFELIDFTYLVWKQLVLNVLESFGLTMLVDGSGIISSQTIDTTDKKIIVNPDLVWKKIDTAILFWINATLIS